MRPLEANEGHAQRKEKRVREGVQTDECPATAAADRAERAHDQSRNGGRDEDANAVQAARMYERRREREQTHATRHATEQKIPERCRLRTNALWVSGEMRPDMCRGLGYGFEEELNKDVAEDFQDALEDEPKEFLHQRL
jgi:hypothetical protein